MGGSTSRFAETDWNNASGGIKNGEGTIDGSEPTKNLSILTLKQNHSIVDQRSFIIVNDCNRPQYARLW